MHTGPTWPTDAAPPGKRHHSLQALHPTVDRFFLKRLSTDYIFQGVNWCKHSNIYMVFQHASMSVCFLYTRTTDFCKSLLKTSLLHSLIPWYTGIIRVVPAAFWHPLSMLVFKYVIQWLPVLFLDQYYRYILLLGLTIWLSYLHLNTYVYVSAYWLSSLCFLLLPTLSGGLTMPLFTLMYSYVYQWNFTNPVKGPPSYLLYATLFLIALGIVSLSHNAQPTTCSDILYMYSIYIFLYIYNMCST